MASLLAPIEVVLPPRSVLLEGEDMDERTRAVLWLLLEAAPGAGVPFSPEPTACPNCAAPCLSSRSPYCSEGCKEEAAFVRQLRSAIASGAVRDPERQAALGQKLWHLLGGGYPRRLAIAPPRAIAQAIKREDGKCQVCGAAATTVDHTGSG
ncbi:MAG: hypothetical protein KIT11_00390 [Fimbriimonadaceae bacterium]|nr:hypothetical protein [Fimbriimonadaceae bacterium]QYK55169.1 MAG: hypothetical protein KF733_09145 [Fimbriimonadaceae bacterium]